MAKNRTLLITLFTLCLLGTARAADSSQLIRAGDTLDVQIAGERSLSGEYQVTSFGDLVIPYLDIIYVKGLSVDDFSRLLREKLAHKNLSVSDVVVLISKHGSETEAGESFFKFTESQFKAAPAPAPYIVPPAPKKTAPVKTAPVPAPAPAPEPKPAVEVKTETEAEPSEAVEAAAVEEAEAAPAPSLMQRLFKPRTEDKKAPAAQNFTAKNETPATEVKPAVKARPKPQAKPAAKAKPKPAPKPQPRPEPDPEPADEPEAELEPEPAVDSVQTASIEEAAIRREEAAEPELQPEPEPEPAPVAPPKKAVWREVKKPVSKPKAVVRPRPAPAPEPEPEPEPMLEPEPEPAEEIFEAAPEPARAARSAVSDKNVIHGGDKLKIKVQNEADLTGEFTVSSTGMLTYPLLGEVDTRGRTPDALREYLRTELGVNYLFDPQVEVELVQSQNNSVDISGTVGKPGNYLLTPNMTVLRLITQAGGLTGSPSSTKLQVVRSSANGKKRSYDAEFSKIVTGKSPDIRLERGDLIFVETVSDTAGDYKGAAKKNLVSMLGMVTKPGNYRVADDMTLVRLIAEGGGFAAGAATGRVRLIRTVKDGKKVMQIDVGAIMAGRSEDIRVEDGDVIIVQESYF